MAARTALNASPLPCLALSPLPLSASRAVFYGRGPAPPPAPRPPQPRLCSPGRKPAPRRAPRGRPAGPAASSVSGGSLGRPLGRGRLRGDQAEEAGASSPPARKPDPFDHPKGPRGPGGGPALAPRRFLASGLAFCLGHPFVRRRGGAWLCHLRILSRRLSFVPHLYPEPLGSLQAAVGCLARWGAPREAVPQAQPSPRPGCGGQCCDENSSLQRGSGGDPNCLRGTEGSPLPTAFISGV